MSVWFARSLIIVWCLCVVQAPRMLFLSWVVRPVTSCTVCSTGCTDSTSTIHALSCTAQTSYARAPGCAAILLCRPCNCYSSVGLYGPDGCCSYARWYVPTVCFTGCADSSCVGVCGPTFVSGCTDPTSDVRTCECTFLMSAAGVRHYAAILFVLGTLRTRRVMFMWGGVLGCEVINASCAFTRLWTPDLRSLTSAVRTLGGVTQKLNLSGFTICPSMAWSSSVPPYD